MLGKEHRVGDGVAVVLAAEVAALLAGRGRARAVAAGVMAAPLV